MSTGLIAITLFVITLVASYLFVAKASPLFEKWGLVDRPGPQRVNPNVVARGLGVAMYLAFLVGLGVSFSLPVDRYAIETERILLMIIGAAIIVAVMLVDDAVSLPATVRLIWQIIASMMIIMPRFQGESRGIILEQVNLPIFGVTTIPLVVAVIGTVIWLVGMMNAMNWVDGLDGLAGTISLVACIVIFIHTYWGFDTAPQFTISLLPLMLGAAILGFLPFNWFPSKVIMGDAGAMFLGYMLGVISLIGGAKIGMILLVLGIPILDGLWVTINRIMNGQNATHRDTRHLHHRLLRAGFNQQQIVLLMGGISGVFGAMALFLPNQEAKLAALFILGALLMMMLWWLARHPGKEIIDSSAPTE